LARAGISVEAWVVNQSLTPLSVTDPVLRARQSDEQPFLRQLAEHTTHTVVEPWRDAGPA
jgi:arsenite-transporting ATPase